MASINTSDILFATLTNKGSKLLSLRISGISSYSELIKTIRSMTPAHALGLITLQLRNHSQGWSSTRPLLMA